LGISWPLRDLRGYRLRSAVDNALSFTDGLGRYAQEPVTIDQLSEYKPRDLLKVFDPSGHRTLDSLRADLKSLISKKEVEECVSRINSFYIQALKKSVP
jgi:hypothetical protein